MMFASTVILAPVTFEPSLKTPRPNLETWSCKIVCDCVNSLAWTATPGLKRTR